MIWLIARDNKNITEKQKRFNNQVALIYMAICLSMFPVTAASFILVKIVNPAGQGTIYSFYFILWLILALFFIIKKDIGLILKYTLLSGGIIGFFVPIVNGCMTGNWLWLSAMNDSKQLFIIDAFWLMLSGISIGVFLKLHCNLKNIPMKNNDKNI